MVCMYGPCRSWGLRFSTSRTKRMTNLSKKLRHPIECTDPHSVWVLWDSISSSNVSEWLKSCCILLQWCSFLHSKILFALWRNSRWFAELIFFRLFDKLLTKNGRKIRTATNGRRQWHRCWVLVVNNDFQWSTWSYQKYPLQGSGEVSKITNLSEREAC